MAVQIPFPNGADFPPEQPKSYRDIVIEHLFMVLPAQSLPEAMEKLRDRGLEEINIRTLRAAIRHLRKNALVYQWTIPHVKSSRPIEGELKYFGVLLERDPDFHTNPVYKKQLLAGTEAIVRRLTTESSNQSMMLKASSSATYITRALREELAELGDELVAISKKAKRVIRYIRANGG